MPQLNPTQPLNPTTSTLHPITPQVSGLITILTLNLSKQMAIGLYISFATFALWNKKNHFGLRNPWFFGWVFWPDFGKFLGRQKKQQCDRVSVPKRWWWIWWETKTRNDGWDDLLGENWQCWDGGIHTQATSWKHKQIGFEHFLCLENLTWQALLEDSEIPISKLSIPGNFSFGLGERA